MDKELGRPGTENPRFQEWLEANGTSTARWQGNGDTGFLHAIDVVRKPFSEI
jgi:hypothetical protein